MSSHKMHTNEADIDIALVKRLLASQFPQWSNLPIKPITSLGTDNVIYRLGNDMSIRLPRIEEAAANIDKECRWLPKLHPMLPLPIPLPLGKGEPGEGYPYAWSIYQWLDGENAAMSPITNLHQAAIDLGKFVATLHKIETTNAPFANRGLPLASRDEETRAAIDCLHDQFDTNKVWKIWNSALAISPWQGSPRWVHGDLHESNLLAHDGKLTAVIDFGCAGVGDPACDMMVAWTLLSNETRKLFHEIIQVDDATWARGRGWALTFGIVALPYYEKTNPILASIARKTIENVLTDLDNI